MNAAKLESDELKARSHGRWVEIFSILAPELDEAVQRMGRHVACPMHGSNDGFRLFRDAADTGGGVCSSCGAFHDGFALLRALRGWSFPEVLEQVDDALGGAVSQPQPAVIKPKAAKAPSRSTRYGLRRHWKAGVRDEWAKRLLEDYLVGRGLSPVLAEIWLEEARVHPAMPYRNDERKVVGEWPCVMTLVRDAEGRAITMHRLWLERLDAKTVVKAPVDCPKKLYPLTEGASMSGGAIRFGKPVGRTLGIAEGIETALAVTAATGMTTWACVSASIMPSFVPPEGVDTVVVWADKDRAKAQPLLPNGEQRPPKHPGLDAARALQKRLWSEGIKAAVQLPPVEIPAGKDSIDWADVYSIEQRQGPMSLLI